MDRIKQMDADDAARAEIMLTSPKNWPNWPFLPMKQYVMVGGVPQVNVGYSVTADYPLVILEGFPSMKAILLQIACEDGEATPEQQELYERYVWAHYSSPTAMFADGWRID